MANAPHEYATHNFDAVNSYVNEMGQRHHLANSMTRASLFSTYAKWGAVVLVAAGVAGFLGAWGYSLLIKKPEPKIITTEKIIERPIRIEPNIYISGTETGDQNLNEARQNAAERVIQLSENARPLSLTPEREETTPVYNFTIFKTVPYDRDGVDEIVVGMRYSDNNSKSPFEQWCYILVKQSDDIERHLNLAFKSEKNGLRNTTLKYSQATSLQTSLSTLHSAQSLCPFE
jgi:hypothetical protein